MLYEKGYPERASSGEKLPSDLELGIYLEGFRAWG